jgi:protein-S-isoprenylcysteine O-methyltransferase Ste14
LSAKREVRGPGTRGILHLLTDMVFVLLAMYLLLGYARTLLQSPESWFFLVRQGFFIFYLIMSLVLFAIRDRASAYSSRILDYVYAILGLGSPLLFQPTSSVTLVFGEFLEIVGSILVLSGFLSLNRSFGLGPENRGIKTAGAYRVVRHPMYSGYILAEAGFFLNNFSFYNLLILAISILFLLLRLRAEEMLLERDPSYRKYARSVRWRLMPRIF